MTNEKLNLLLSILDEYEISLDINEEELSLLNDDLVDRLQLYNSKIDVVSTLYQEIDLLRSKIRERINGFSNSWEEEKIPTIFESFINHRRKP